VALIGSSGVGKSTLLNNIADKAPEDAQATGGYPRGGNAKGRHTTTSRSLHIIQTAGWCLIPRHAHPATSQRCGHSVWMCFCRDHRAGTTVPLSATARHQHEPGLCGASRCEAWHAGPRQAGAVAQNLGNENRAIRQRSLARAATKSPKCNASACKNATRSKMFRIWIAYAAVHHRPNKPGYFFGTIPSYSLTHKNFVHLLNWMGRNLRET